MKSDMSKRADKAKIQDVKFREMPDIVVKVVCRYRAELFFKISRKTKLSRLFNAWTERMETGPGVGAGAGAGSAGGLGGMGAGKKSDMDGKGVAGAQANGSAKTDAASTTSNSGSNSSVSGSSSSSSSSSLSSQSMQFIFTHNGRSADSDQTPEEAGMEDGDEILAVELMDLTEGTGVGAESGSGEEKGEEWEELIEPRRQKLRKNWTDNPKEWVNHLTFIFFDPLLLVGGAI
jgi:hypothetical protein